MERSLSSLTFKGSIPEAIAEAKKQKKLLVVYISGEDKESISLENTTWTDFKVAESLSKYCILLHIPEASTDATNFCAIYPQNSTPCITAIGYNGVQVWKTEGFVSAEVLASSLEKAWLSLHIQETTATVLTAALASKESKPATSGSSVIGASDQGCSSGTNVPSHSFEKHVQSSEAGSSIRSEMVKENKSEMNVKTPSKIVGDSLSGIVEDEHSTSFPEAVEDSPTTVMADEHSTSSSKAVKDSLSTVMVDLSNSQAEHTSFGAVDSPALASSPAIERNIDHQFGVPKLGSKVISSQTNEGVQNEKTDDGMVSSLGNCGRVSELSDVYLNIRLPSGFSLREKFSLISSLRIVKDYVDRNDASGLGSYDLAIPYPRKIFSDDDLSKSLSELSLFNRQALIVVPHQRASGYHGGSSASEKTSASNSDFSNERDGGYLSQFQRMLSYLNPFSYFSSGASSSSSGQDFQSGLWEYSPNPARQENFARRETNDNNSLSRRDNENRPRTTSRFGSNIHTLKHDDDDDRFSGRNAFWNGNSTQYGGDNNGR